MEGNGLQYPATDVYSSVYIKTKAYLAGLVDTSGKQSCERLEVWMRVKRGENVQQSQMVQEFVG